MEGSELSDQSYAVLVMIALRGPSTAYDVERALGPLTREYWAVPHTQVYRECARLEKAGLVREQREEKGRRKRVYTVTAKGRREIADWIREPSEGSMEIRDASQMKLLAAELSTTQDIRALAERQVVAYRRRLEVLDEMLDRFKDRPEIQVRLLAVSMGKGVYRAALNFWQGIVKDPPKVG